jgi:hypothetical protein
LACGSLSGFLGGFRAIQQTLALGVEITQVIGLEPVSQKADRPEPTRRANTGLQPIALTGAREKVSKKSYIRAPKQPNPTFEKALEECKADKSWRTFETVVSGHDVMIDAPEWLVDVLLEVS